MLLKKNKRKVEKKLFCSKFVTRCFLYPYMCQPWGWEKKREKTSLKLIFIPYKRRLKLITYQVDWSPHLPDDINIPSSLSLLRWETGIFQWWHGQCKMALQIGSDFKETHLLLNEHRFKLSLSTFIFITPVSNSENFNFFLLLFSLSFPLQLFKTKSQLLHFHHFSLKSTLFESALLNFLPCIFKYV